MKVLHLTTFGFGGAAIAAKRLVAAERALGIDAELKTMEDFGYSRFKYRLGRKLEKVLLSFMPSTNAAPRSLGWRSSGVVEKINATDADIIHLHWICDGFLSIADIAALRKKLVWTLHDSWPFCGKTHHPDPTRGDRGDFVLRRKLRLWKNLDCVFTAPSEWEKAAFDASEFGVKRRCVKIPNIVRTYPRLGSEGAEDKKTILFGACDVNDPIKGASILSEALAILKTKLPEFEVVSFGKGGTLGVIDEGAKLNELYHRADVFVCPSLLESFSLTSAEALAAGTPVVAFDVGGVKDVVTHLATGYLARPYSAEDLARGIEWAVGHKAELTENCRAEAQRRFAPEKVAAAYKEVYDEITAPR